MEEEKDIEESWWGIKEKQLLRSASSVPLFFPTTKMLLEEIQGLVTLVTR